MENDDEFKPVWPIPEDGIRYGDAVETAYALADAKLNVTNRTLDDADYSGALFIDLVDFQEWFDEFVIFKRIGLIDALDECLGDNVDDINDEIPFDDWLLKYQHYNKESAENYNKSLRLLVRLVRACREWEATDAKMTMEEMIANPLPATASASDPEPDEAPSPQPEAR